MKIKYKHGQKEKVTIDMDYLIFTIYISNQGMINNGTL